MQIASPATKSIRDERLSLRNVLRADGVLVGGSGVLFSLAAGILSDWLGYPEGFLRWIGVSLLPIAGVILFTATRQSINRRLTTAIIVVNLLWVIGSIALLISGWGDSTTLGVAFVIAQGLLVLAFADLEWLAVRRAS